MALLAPSILSADFARLEAHAREAVDAGAEWLHVDVMDGRFVPNITMGPLAVTALQRLRRESNVFIDVHLMIERPEAMVKAFVEAGADLVTVHAEATPHLHRTLQEIRELGARTGVAVNPATPLVVLEEVMTEVDLVLIMSVNPGFGGQAYIPFSTGRIARMRRMLDESRSRAFLEVDGGITVENVGEVARAGADVIVAGTSVFGGSSSVADNVRALRHAMLPTA